MKDRRQFRVYITNWIANKPAAGRDFRKKRELSMIFIRAGYKY